MVSRRRFALGLGLGLGALLLHAPGRALAKKPDANGAAEVSQVVKTIVQAVRNGKDAQAIKLFDLEAQGRYLCGDAWDKASPAARDEFMSLFSRIFPAIAFPKVRETFKQLDSITYDPPNILGGLADVSSTVFIKHPMKTQELKLRYTLAKREVGWRLFDMRSLGDSVLGSIRDDQVKPLLDEGGWDRLLEAMRKEDARLAKTRSKPR